VWVEPWVRSATRATAARLVAALTEPFVCKFRQLASQGNGERSAMLQKAAGSLPTLKPEEPVNFWALIGPMPSDRGWRCIEVDESLDLGMVWTVIHDSLPRLGGETGLEPLEE